MGFVKVCLAKIASTMKRRALVTYSVHAELLKLGAAFRPTLIYNGYTLEGLQLLSTRNIII